ncbi:class I SAM-dependent methyltransferase [Nodularia spumigena]|uniref:class I SAM-dependent methyltransferase n=1 Tax=Nodularia spumigena TaxID=70799 RepID=UPI00233139FD|nr:class I SAM-dependent methyltransferase [Nodularia spumigena]MDB9347426.1 class I SAM-dependent methyltransferase [Nodularia spumigena CS-588/01]MDB9354472.1 class I SAM-dependent methyltransferase [Nodularia spumigena CS-588/05]
MLNNLKKIKNTVKNLSKEIKVFLYNLAPQSRQNIKEVFRHRMVDGVWAGLESISGHGSDMKSTENLRQILPNILSDFNVKSLLDAPCGDFYWMSKTDLKIDSYVGIDIVSEIIDMNQQKYTKEGVKFIVLDIINDNLPKADLILCRDCLVHLSCKQIKNAILNFKQSGSTYLLTTTYPNLLEKNKDILTGEWRPLDLEKSPFYLPKPIILVNENCITDLKEKSLALWRLTDIEI